MSRSEGEMAFSGLLGRGRRAAARVASIGALALTLCSTPGIAATETGDEPEPNAGAEATAEASDYDYLDGVEPNGRIPRPELPGDLLHPERWRYIPEGRIKPGNLFQRFMVSSFIVPFVFRDADVGTGLGLAITDIDFRQQRRREFLGAFASYTTEGQQAYVLHWRRWLRHREMPEGGVIQEERSYLRLGGGYRKTLTRRFFGYGPKADNGAETSYTDEVGYLDGGLSLSLPVPADDFVLEVDATGELHWLDRGRVGGQPSTEESFPGVIDAAERARLGWIGTELRWDTRDSQRNPYRGSVLGARVDAALLQRDWDVGARYRLYGIQIVRVPPLFHDGGDPEEAHPPTDVLAFNVATELSSGDLPFFDRPTLGGSYRLRGYIDGRFRDRASWYAAAEYRLWLIARGFTVYRQIRVERIGLAFFYECGSVADDGLAFFHEPVRQSYGVGIRATLERAAIFRLDVGISAEDVNVSGGFGLSF